MDASVAAVGLFLSEDVMGVTLGLWAKLQFDPSNRSRTIDSTVDLPLWDLQPLTVRNLVSKMVSLAG